MAKNVRIVSAVEGSEDLADTLRELMLYEGYRTMREFTLRTYQYRFPELKPLIDWELRERMGKPKSLKRGTDEA